MKKLFTLVTVCAMIAVNAQIFSEDFSGGVPGNLIESVLNGSLNWEDCGGDLGGINCSGGVATFYHTAVSPHNTALDTPVLDMSDGIYKVSFTLAKRTKNNRTNEFYLEVSTDGGDTFTTVESFLSEIDSPTLFTYVLAPYNTTDQTVVRFRGKNRGGYALYLDNISIKEVLGDDIAVTFIDLPDLMGPGSTEIKGTLQNYGVNDLTSFDLNWQDNEGTVHTQNYSGQNIAPGTSFNFTHQDSWNAQGGQHEVKVWVSNTNITDTDPDNDLMIKEVQVASGISDKRPLYERFTSSTCGPCYSYNVPTFDPFFFSYGIDKAILISHQVNWPGAGDPYYTSEVAARVSYYGINAAPTILFNAEDLNLPNSSVLKTTLDNELENNPYAFFKIDADHSIDGNMLHIDVDITPYLTANNLTVQVVAIEKTTTQNKRTNGEVEFHHVYMKAFPNAQGTTVNFVQDQVETLSFSHDMSTTNVEEMDDLAVVVFIQNNSTKEIIQSGYTAASGIVLDLDEVFTASNNVKIAPNPSSGNVRVFTDKEVSVKVMDLTGKTVFTQKAVSNNGQLNLSHLSKGAYIVVFTSKDGVRTTEKLMIK